MNYPYVKASPQHRLAGLALDAVLMTVSDYLGSRADARKANFKDACLRIRKFEACNLVAHGCPSISNSIDN
jgi:hypothetical protein